MIAAAIAVALALAGARPRTRRIDGRPRQAPRGEAGAGRSSRS